MSRILILAMPLVLAAGVSLHAQAGQAGQGGMGGRGMMGGGGMMQDAGHQADMQLPHALFENRAHITRKVTPTADGVDTLTESDVPAVAKLIQAHAEVVSLFIANGMAEAMKNHPVPVR